MTTEATNRLGVKPTFALAGIGVVFASICFGIVPYFSRTLTDQGLAPQAVAFYRYVITAAILLPALIGSAAKWREILWGLGAGATMGAGWIGYVAAIEVTPASTVGVLYMTYPIFTVLIAWVLFRERVTRRAFVASGMILLAAVIAGNPQFVTSDQMSALIISLAAPFGFGFGICVLVHRLSRIPPLARIASVSFGSFLALFPLVMLTETSQVLPQNATVWALVAGLAIASALVPQLIYVVCSPVIGASRTAVYGSIELPTMFAVSVFAFGEKLTWSQAVACVLVMSAIILTQSRATRNVSVNVSKP